MTSPNLDAELELALRLVREAEGPILSRFQKSIEVVTKRDNTPVTEADREAEILVRKRLNEFRPDHGVIGEEFGVTSPEARYQWVIDPIDGTKAFIHGVPLFGTLLALLEDGVPVVGVIHMPALAETVWARRGGGAFHNGNSCRVSAVSTLEDALLCDGSALTVSRSPWGDAWMELRGGAGVSRGWGDCYGHLLVTCGRAEAMLDPVVNIWDVAPMGIILPEAGGTFTALDGSNRIDAGNAISSNGILHSIILDRITPIKTNLAIPKG